jgi:tetratricopeptide (TPR) repeat protein
MGRICYREDSYKDAIKHLEKALQLLSNISPDMPLSFLLTNAEPGIKYYMGLSYYGLKDYKKAAQYYREAYDERKKELIVSEGARAGIKLAYCYLRGQGVPQNVNRAEELAKEISSDSTMSRTVKDEVAQLKKDINAAR